jgi:hypothetical protein
MFKSGDVSVEVIVSHSKMFEFALGFLFLGGVRECIVKGLYVFIP